MARDTTGREVRLWELSLDDAYEQTVTGTRRYVRRQRSWFNRDKRITWLDAAGDTAAQALRALG